jgi:hypothetical protein
MGAQAHTRTRAHGRLAAAVTTVALAVTGGAVTPLLTAAPATAALPSGSPSASGIAAAVPLLSWEGTVHAGVSHRGPKALAIASDGSEVAVWSDGELYRTGNI